MANLGSPEPGSPVPVYPDEVGTSIANSIGEVSALPTTGASAGGDAAAYAVIILVIAIMLIAVGVGLYLANKQNGAQA